jgi:polysaccharide export outer membrane protein
VKILQDENIAGENLQVPFQVNNLIKPNDDLYIEVSSISAGGATNYNFFNEDRGQTVGMAGRDYSMISYPVNDSGYVLLPIIGYFHVTGLSLHEAALKIETELNDYMSNPTVKVRFVNRYISVLGEVRNPGTFYLTKDNLNVLQGIGMAGDFTYYGNRKNVTLFRTEGDQLVKISLDLTDNDFVSSKYYYLQDDDVLYVEPLKRRAWGFQAFPWAILLSTISTTFLIIRFYQTQP